MSTAARTAIVIPARYGSSRFPGKPLAKIGGQTMLSRVVDVARAGARKFKNVDIMVTTEDQSIAAHAGEIGIKCIMTAADCPTGSDRVLQAVKKSGENYDFVINLQGDAPFTPPAIIGTLIEEIQNHKPAPDVVTPIHQLTWAGLDALRAAKKTTPFSGTTVTVDADGHALWFSKTIIPALRSENREEKKSPVFQHIGIYGFRLAALEKFVALPQSRYEQLEGLEQLRLIENGISILCVAVDVPEGGLQAGIDSPEDLARAEARLKSA
jgi:3-deoxy-manno-octulosonate cytidylyltransferase (CMP-KDO synthetase)